MTEKKRIIKVVPYDPDWPAEYQKGAKAILGVLKDQSAHIHHFGSTAVPGLRAKPVIDILLETQDLDSLVAFDPEMEQLGYIQKVNWTLNRKLYQPKM